MRKNLALLTAQIGHFRWRFSGRVVSNNHEHASLEEFLRQLDSVADAKGLSPKSRVEFCRMNLTDDAV